MRALYALRQAGYGVEQDYDVLAAFYEALGALEGQLGYFGVVFHGLIEGGGDYFAMHRAHHIGYFLRPLTDEAYHEVGFFSIVSGDAVSYGLEEEGLACLGRRNDKTALASAYGGDEVQQAHRYLLRGGLQVVHGGGEDRGKVAEVGALFGGFSVKAVDRFYAQKAVVFLAFFGLAHLAEDHIAWTQAEAAYLALAYIDVIGAGQVALHTHEAEPVVHDVKDASLEDVALLFGLSLQDAQGEVVFLDAAKASKLQFFGDFLEVIHCARFELGQRGKDFGGACQAGAHALRARSAHPRRCRRRRG